MNCCRSKTNSANTRCEDRNGTGPDRANSDNEGGGKLCFGNAASGVHGEPDRDDNPRERDLIFARAFFLPLI